MGGLRFFLRPIVGQPSADQHTIDYLNADNYRKIGFTVYVMFLLKMCLSIESAVPDLK